MTTTASTALAAISGGPTYSSTTEEAAKDLGRDEFLNLLVAQLKNQDPLNPMEGADFTAQLAQFSSLEQQFDTNDRLEQILEAVSNQTSNDYLGVVGKTVSAGDDKMVVKLGEASPAGFTIEENAEVTINIFDSYGIQVRTLNLGEVEAGSHSFDWDGRNYYGEQAPDATYTYEIAARDSAGGIVSATSNLTGEVDGITYKYGEPYLIIGERLVPAASLTEVRTSESAG